MIYHTIQKITLVLLGILGSLANMQAADIHSAHWQITLNSNRSFTFTFDEKTLLKNAYARAISGENDELLSIDYPTVTQREETVNDAFGTGTKYVYTFSGRPGKPDMEQTFYLYTAHNYLLTELSLVASTGIVRSHLLSPLTTTSPLAFLPTQGDNRVLTVPFDNDKFRTYNAMKWSLLSIGATSSEVTAFYNIATREAFCLGSIEHDTWKTGIEIRTSGVNTLRRLTLYGGYAGPATNDVSTRHGSLSGSRIKSPKMFIGYFKDWRIALETFADANALVRPKKEAANKGVFGWQSWGGMEKNVNYEGVADVSDFFAQNLQNQHFGDDTQRTYMVLDSFWDNLNETQLRSFASLCTAKGQIPGIYFTPFSFWGKETDLDWTVPGTNGQYRFRDIILRANGNPIKVGDALSLDPTHPGTKQMIEHRFALFRAWGYRFVKLDFLNSGSVEADSYYNTVVTTGMQAYTEGMLHVESQLSDFFIDLSIAPLFPNFGHARRISCDAWGKISDSQYVLNSLSMGWWLDRLYAFNDPDHIVFAKSNDGANRIRYTTGVITGMVLLGDNFSLKGTYKGIETYREQALRTATKEAVNAVARLGRSFRPVEGALSSVFSRGGTDNIFCLDTPEAFYVAVFNFNTTQDLSLSLDRKRLGANNTTNVTELWTGEQTRLGGETLPVFVPKGDVRLYKLDKTGTAIYTPESGTSGIEVSRLGHLLHITAPECIRRVELFDLSGSLIIRHNIDGESVHANIPIPDIQTFIIKTLLCSGRKIGKSVSCPSVNKS